MKRFFLGITLLTNLFITASSDEKPQVPLAFAATQGNFSQVRLAIHYNRTEASSFPKALGFAVRTFYDRRKTKIKPQTKKVILLLLDIENCPLYRIKKTAAYKAAQKRKDGELLALFDQRNQEEKAMWQAIHANLETKEE